MDLSRPEALREEAGAPGRLGLSALGVYALAWLAYALLFAGIFIGSGQVSLSRIAYGVVANEPNPSNADLRALYAYARFAATPPSDLAHCHDPLE